MEKVLTICLLFCLAFFQKNEAAAQCSPDVTPPDVVITLFESTVLQGATVEVWASDFDVNSSDNCPGDLTFSFSSDPADQSQLFDCSNLGNNPLEIWVTDQAGNQASASATMVILGNPNPTLACNALTTVSVPTGGTATIEPDDILEGGPYCPPIGWSFQLDLIPSVGASPSIEFDETDIGIHVVRVGLYDDDGNLGNACWGEVEVVSCGVNTPPIAVCDANVTVTVVSGGTQTVSAESFDDGSWDACTPQNDLIFRIENGLPPSPSAPSATSITFDENDEGLNNVVLWVGDTGGNWNTCVIEVTVSVLDCDNDTQAPTPYCYNGLNVELDPDSTEVEIWATDFDAGSFDNCTAANDLIFRLENTGTPSATPPSTESVTLPEGTHSMAMWVGDEAGNWDYCQTLVTVSSCTPMTTLVCNDYVQVSLTPGGTMDFVPDMILEGGPLCPGPGNYFALQLDPPSTPMPSIPLTAANAGESIVSVGLYDADDNLIVGECWGTINVWAWWGLYGQVFADTTADCENIDEPVLSGQTVQAVGLVTGNIYEGLSTSSGEYNIAVDVADTLVEVNLPVGFNYGGTCGTTYTVSASSTAPGLSILDIPVQLSSDCPLLSVDISASYLRRCFENTYEVNYCNLSTETIEDVSIEVTLDEYMDVLGTSTPGTQLDSVTWSFEIGTLIPGKCGQFSIDFLLNCEAPFGLTHCVEAHIMPDTICPQLSNFSGANIEVGGYCENDSIYLNIKNTGTGNMAMPLDYIVVQDVIMFQGPTSFDLPAGQTIEIDPIYADGATYRLEAPQETNHPYGGVAAIAIEGCGETFTPGFVNFFPMNDPNPFISTDCQENIGAYDPNDKQAFPRGYGDEHFIEKNTDIEYMIRFQNTGTDTAFNVVIVDTLSTHLDAMSVRPGASSHTYNFEVLDGNILRFTFPNIMLPDSNVNVALSQGFVKFRASQILDLENDIVIENTAAIYFDFNEPVITNTVFHTIGEHFIEVINSTEERPAGLGDLTVYPNPSIGFVNFELPTDAPDEAVFQLHDHLGRLVKTEQFTGRKYRFERGALSAGIYFYSVDLEGLGRYTGKVILK